MCAFKYAKGFCICSYIHHNFIIFSFFIAFNFTVKYVRLHTYIHVCIAMMEAAYWTKLFTIINATPATCIQPAICRICWRIIFLQDAFIAFAFINSFQIFLLFTLSLCLHFSNFAPARMQIHFHYYYGISGAESFEVYFSALQR